MEKEIVKEYTKDNLTIIWKPKLCIHAGICAKKLPEVYHPKDKPWITPEHASVDALKSQINNCPSGALSFRLAGEEDSETTTASLVAEIMPDGPALIKGSMEVKLTDGRTEQKEGVTAFCRCGASENKPYCDGSHKKIDFKG